jgi:hypothetical protein
VVVVDDDAAVAIDVEAAALGAASLLLLPIRLVPAGDDALSAMVVNNDVVS